MDEGVFEDLPLSFAGQATFFDFIGCCLPSICAPSAR
jgi:hypothetical protein